MYHDLGNSDSMAEARSSHGDVCSSGISIGLLLTTLLGIGVMFSTLFTKVTMAMVRRKKRSTILDSDDVSLDLNTIMQDHFYSGRLKVDFFSLT